MTHNVGSNLGFWKNFVVLIMRTEVWSFQSRLSMLDSVERTTNETDTVINAMSSDKIEPIIRALDTPKNSSRKKTLCVTNFMEKSFVTKKPNKKKKLKLGENKEKYPCHTCCKKGNWINCSEFEGEK